MPTPTERVTRHAQEFLGDEHDVVLALRVDWGPDAVASRTRFGNAFWVRAYLWTPIVWPFMALLRLPETLRRRKDPSAGSGILALTSDDGRIVLSSSPLRRNRPTSVVEALPEGSALLPDAELMETDMIPTLTVNNRQFVVNGVDFRALLNAVETATIRAPEIKAVLVRLLGVGTSNYTGAPGATG